MYKYQEIKRIATTKLKMASDSHCQTAAMLTGKPVITQCMIGQNIAKNSPMYRGNMSMKVAMKLGGVTHIIKNPKASRSDDATERQQSR